MALLFEDDHINYEQEYIINITMAIFAGVFLVALLYIGWRVYQIIRCHDYVLMMMIFFLNLELLSIMFFYIVNAHED